MVATCSGALAFASTGDAPSAAAAGPLRLTVGTLGSIGSLDPRRGFSMIAEEVWNLQYPTLTTLDPNTLDPAPGLAAAWSPAPGGKGWIYRLRPGLTWSDGQPVTAADVVYSLDEARAQRWPYTVSSESFVSGLTAVALNANSVQVVPNDVDWILPSLLLHVVPEHVYAKVANLDSNLTALAVSDGAWHVAARTTDSVELDAANAASGAAVKQIVFRTYPTAAALIDALARKQVDVVSGLPDADIGTLEAMSGVTVDHASDGTQWVLRDRLSDQSARQAISLAIDRTALVADAVNGVGTPGVVPQLALGSTWQLDDSTVQSLTASLDAQPGRARQLLATAPRIARPLTVSISQSADAQRVGSLVRRALAAVGVATTAVDGDNDNAYSRADLVLTQLFFGDNPFYPYSALDLIVCDHCARSPNLPSTNFTKLVEIAKSRVQRVTEQARLVGLFEPDELQAFRTDRFAGFLPQPQERSLVVFGPTIAQYSELTAAPLPPGEGSSNTTYVVGAVIVLALCAAAYATAAWIRRRFVPIEGVT
jgi:peptide/nickel transport system substrate-binding protein